MAKRVLVFNKSKPTNPPVSNGAPNLQSSKTDLFNDTSSNSSFVGDITITSNAGMTLDKKSPELKINTPFSDLVNNVIKNSKFILNHNSSNNTILPFNSNYNSYNPIKEKPVDDFRKYTGKIKSYETLMGISQERPVVIAMTQFKSLINASSTDFKKFLSGLDQKNTFESFLTDEGLYMDAQFQARNLTSVRVVRTIQDLKLRNKYFDNYFAQKIQEFTKNLDLINDYSLSLFYFLKRKEIIQNALDLKDRIYEVVPNNIIDGVYLNFVPLTAKKGTIQGQLYEQAKKYLPEKYDIVDLLIRFGYRKDNVQNYFSSTKLWLQSLLEIKNLLRYHSLEFMDIPTSLQKNDNNSSNITKISDNFFKFADQDPKGLASVLDLTSLDEKTLKIDTFINAFSHLFENSHFKSNESRISSLVNIVSKEFNYSTGLAKKEVKDSLSKFYGYTVNTNTSLLGNTTLFDNVIGQFGHSILDFPETPTNSLTGLSQKVENDVAILTFESKFLEGDNNTITPGYEYYINNIYTNDNLDLTNATKLTNQLKEARKNFGIICNQLNFFSINDTDQLKDQSNNNNSDYILSNPRLFFEKFINSIMDSRGDLYGAIKEDKLTAIFASANSDVKLKSYLFLYLIFKITRSYSKNSVIQNSNHDNTAVSDSIISSLMNHLFESTKQTGTSSQILKTKFSALAQDRSSISYTTIQKSLKQGTYLSNTLADFLSLIFLAFEKSGAIQNDRTLYSGQLDTTILMTIFEMMVDVIASYTNQKIIGKYQDKETNFIFQKDSSNQKNSLTSIKNRLDKEIALTHQAIYAILNALGNLSGATNNFIDNINHKDFQGKIKKIFSLLPDPTLKELLFNNQQILLQQSYVADLTSRAKKQKAISSKYPKNHVDGDGNFTGDEQVKIIDESWISPQIKNALFATFSAEDFVSEKFNNGASYNKKILTVGLPAGFGKNLKQEISLKKLKKNSFSQKQSDIVNVLVYKRDMVNQDIIFKPKEFLFELSRFPVKDPSTYLNLSENPTLQEIIQSIPTRDFEESIEGTDNKSVGYWNTQGTVGKDKHLAMSTESYSFLNLGQKNQIIQNHIMSYLLELYIRLMTGISTSDFDFDFTEAEHYLDAGTLELLTSHVLQQGVSDTPSDTIPDTHLSNSHLFSSTITQSNSVKPTPNTRHHPVVANQASIPKTNLTTVLNTLTPSNLSSALEDLKTINQLARFQTTISSGDKILNKIISPKQFDRVFNIIVDSDEFEIDFEQTIATEIGKVSFEKLIQKGEIVPSDTSTIRKLTGKNTISVINQVANTLAVGNNPDPNINNYHFKSRNKNEGDLLFDKFFVVIKTFDEEV